MPIDILLTVIATTLVQSIFGVGVLLFGTPILLLLGYDFVNALSVLLPISIAINCLQIIKHYRNIDIIFYRKILIYCIPFIIFFLFFVSTSSFNISLLVGGFLILVALKNFLPKVDHTLEKLFKFERTCLAVMGLIHGLTNLGGSLLTAMVYSKKQEKNATRVTVAICYATFAIFQLATLFFIGSPVELSVTETMSLVQLGVLIFLLTEEIVYNTIDNEKYQQYFALFLLVSGLLLIFK